MVVLMAQGPDIADHRRKHCHRLLAVGAGDEVPVEALAVEPGLERCRGGRVGGHGFIQDAQRLVGLHNRVDVTVA